MDPASVVGVIGVVGQIIKAVYQYGDGVSECKAEVARLRAELFGIQAALTQVEHDLASTRADGSSSMVSSNLLSQDSCRVLEEARLLLVPLAESLSEGLSRGDRVTKRLSWPFKRRQVQDIATHLERLKTYFILAATNDTLEATRETAESLQKLHESFQEHKDSEEQRFMEPEVNRWIDPYDSFPTHNVALSAHMEGTGGWFLKGRFATWLSDNSKLLWVSGPPGSGKTCLMAASVARMLENPKMGMVAYFYCSSNHSESQEPRNIISSLIGQLFAQDPRVRNQIIDIYRQRRASKNGRPRPLDEFGLVALIQQACLNIPERVLLFIDAINECAEESMNVIRTLVRVATRLNTAKLVLSSTEAIEGLIWHRFFPSSFNLQEIDIGQGEVTLDINTYIEARFRKESRLDMLRPQVQSHLKEFLCTKHHGSFRWVQCTIDDLARMSTPKAMKEALTGITPSLSDNYKAVLDAVPEDMFESAHSMLLYLVPPHISWITLEELAEAAMFTSVESFCEDDRLIDPKAVVRHLRSLVRYDTLTSKIELAHSSVRDFITSKDRAGKYYIDPVVAKATISRTCVAYLTLSPFRQFCLDYDALERRKQDWPFFVYASLYWTRYIRNLGALNDDVQAAVSRFIASADLPDGGHWASWYQCVFPDGDRGLWMTRPLYMCAREGLLDPLKDILKTCTEQEIERQGGARESTALHVASTYGRVEAVKLLLAAGADPNERNADGHSGVQWAAAMGHVDTVQALIKGGADPKLLEKPFHNDLTQYHDDIDGWRWAWSTNS